MMGEPGTSLNSTISEFDHDGYLPGALSLLEQLDKKMVVQLRDGRTLIGYLRTLDQFGNLVLHRTVERIHVGKAYGDIPRGIFLVRGENVVLAGEIETINTPGGSGVVEDLEVESRTPLEEVSIQEILSRQRAESETKKRLEATRAKALSERGLPPTSDLLQDDLF